MSGLYNGVYVVRFETAAVTTAQTHIQIKAGAARNLDILRAGLFVETTTSETVPVIIGRKSATATVTSFTPLLYNPDSPAADAAGGVSATGTNASAEGTDGDILVEDVFNTLNGWVWVPTPEERIRVEAAGFIALRHDLTITSAVVRGYMVFGEL
jgi:exosome complex RNA-binding protein Rrp4